MKDDNKEYTLNLDSELNELESKPQETSDEKDKIYIPPDINLKNNKEKELDNKDIKKDENKSEINDSEKKKSVFDSLKNLINDVDFMLDDLIHIGPDKEKYKKLFAELRKRRENDEKITEEEFLLFDIMHQQFSNPQKFSFDKIFNIDLDEKNMTNNILNIEKKGTDFFKVYANLIKINKEITLKKAKEENIIINNNNYNNNNNKSNTNEKKEHKSLQCCICFASCLGFLDFFFNDYFEDHCACCISDKYESLNLHKSFIFYIFQYLIYVIIFKFSDFEYLNVWSIVGAIVPGLYGLYIFYKLNYKKFRQNYISYSRFYDFLSISIFKGSVYYLFYRLIKEELLNKNVNEIFIVSFCFKIIFLIFCFFYFMKAKGINFCIIITFGIIGVLISSLVLLFWFSKTEFIIELIICSIQIILFNIGIIISAGKELLIPFVIWNTLTIEIYKLSIILFPVYKFWYYLFFIYTCGYYCCRDD